MGSTPAIEAIVRDLDALHDLTPDALAAALSRDVDLEDVAPWVRFGSDSYARNLIAHTERWELRLLCWRPGQSSSMHGHGRAACAFRIVRGSATEVVVRERDRVWTPGAVVTEKASTVHQVGNSGQDALVTLHAYSPPLPVDAPSTAAGNSVVIVGGGFAGAALAYHLLEHGSPDLRVTLVERGPWIGRGIAYAVESPVYRLNVPASRMSIDPARPDDFVVWAGTEETPHAFLPRTTYGAYVVERLGQAIRRSRAKLRVVRGDVAAVDGHSVQLTDGRALDARKVVLATGLAPRLSPGGLAADPRVVDAWDESGLVTLPLDGRVLVLGTGLTAVDMFAMFEARGFRGSLTFVSRHGLLPLPHLEPFVGTSPLPEDVVGAAPHDLRGLLRWARALVRAAEARGVCWQLALDAVRPHVPRLWQTLSPADRARFVRSVRPYWDVLRHRAPRDTLQRIDEHRAHRGLEVVAGTVLACEPSADGLDVLLRLRGGERRRERFAAIVRCIGPALTFSEGQAPVVTSLVSSGAAVRDAAGLGILTDAEGRVVSTDGQASDRIFALGALRRASEWETTAAPEITRHARALTQVLLADAR